MVYMALLYDFNKSIGAACRVHSQTNRLHNLLQQIVTSKTLIWHFVVTILQQSLFFLAREVINIILFWSLEDKYIKIQSAH